MKPRLGIVLELRQSTEDAAKREVGRLERERAELVDLRHAHQHGLDGACQAPIHPALREQLSCFIASMRGAIAAVDARILAHDAKIDTARAALAKAHREVKAIEAIRARDARAATRIQLRHEARGNDEHAARIRMESMV